ncbi:MAG: 2Fe-2S iron-sulfur cluster-binding protein [Beijerinckiaceae bacterium]
MLTLRVARAEKIAEGICLFELRHPQGADLPEFSPGSHVVVTTPSGDERKYSLSNDPLETDRYVIAVKREEGGRGGSVSMCDNVKQGDELAVSEPKNDFPLGNSPAGYTLIAGGIGITPILAMARHLTNEGKSFKLYYLSRSPETTAFLDELSQPHWRGKVTIHHDGGDPANGYDLWPVLEKPKGQIYCCGPAGLMDAVRDMTGHWSPSAVHFEAFTDGHTIKPEDVPFTVKLAKSGESYEVPVGKPILDVLREHGHDVPFSCEAGSCGSCRTGLISGDVDHRDFVLMDEEKDSNIMVCVSRGRGGVVVIDM